MEVNLSIYNKEIKQYPRNAKQKTAWQKIKLIKINQVYWRIKVWANPSHANPGRREKKLNLKL